MNIKKIVLIAVLAAIICIFAPFSVPAGAIPISLSTFAIYLISCSVPPKYSVPAVAVYILIGAVGIPVFSSFTGGLQCITGYTGGYIIGYIPCAFIIGFMTNKFCNNKFIYPLSMSIGTAVCYISGTLWYMYRAETGFSQAVAICILPFLLGDILKISAASFIGVTLNQRLRKFLI